MGREWRSGKALRLYNGVRPSLGPGLVLVAFLISSPIRMVGSLRSSTHLWGRKGPHPRYLLFIANLMYLDSVPSSSQRFS